MDGLSLAGALVSGVLALVMALVITYEVLIRTLLNAPTSLSTEVSTYALMGMVFFAGAYGVRESGHVRVDILVKLSPRRWTHLMDAVTLLLALTFVLVLGWYGSMLVATSFQQSTTSSSVLRVPLFLPQLTIPVGSAMLALQLVARVVRDVSNAVGSRPPDGSEADLYHRETVADEGAGRERAP